MNYQFRKIPVIIEALDAGHPWNTDPEKLDADHVVPLKWAWEHGASAWTDEQREAFANDSDNIVMVLAAANRSKGAKGPDDWMPPNRAYHVQYLERFDAICKKYGLAQ